MLNPHPPQYSRRLCQVLKSKSPNPPLSQIATRTSRIKLIKSVIKTQKYPQEICLDQLIMPLSPPNPPRYQDQGQLRKPPNKATKMIDLL
jgi:hypothetical protein